MNTDKYLRISYRCIDDGSKRIQCLPLGFVFRIADNENYYDYSVFENAVEVIRFRTGNRIVNDNYGQHWYQRRTRMTGMEEYDIYEPLPPEVVTEEYESKRIAGVNIYPYIRVDFARKLMEVYEEYGYTRNDKEYRDEFYNLNRGFIERYE